MAPLIDYSQIITLVQKGLARSYEQDQGIINIPGKSIALKVDANYYLILFPSFIEHVCKICGVMPKTLLDSLVKTGNLIVDPVTREYVKSVEVKWKKEMKPLKIKVGFLISSFVDNAFKLFGTKKKSPLPVSELKISKRSKLNIDPLFTNKTPLNSSVFFD